MPNNKANFRKYKRSGEEKCPICGIIHRLEEHHIKGRKVRDWKKPYNIAWICPNCHDDVHNGNLVINGWLNSLDGKILEYYYQDC